MIARLPSLLLIAALTACAAQQSADGRTLVVGPTRALKLPSQAAAVARDGDTVRIDPGDYADCAVWRANRLTIEGAGPGVVIADKPCAGKALFVTAGRDITVRGLTLARAAVPDHNGAGIRAEGAGLRVQRVRFLDNEDGILAGANPASTIVVEDSEFRGNGKCEGYCAHAIYAGAIAALEVRRSHFADTHQGHHIKSRAASTVLVGNDIEDGPTGDSSYLVDISNGGDLLMRGNTLEKGPHSSNRSAAVAIGAEGVKNPTHRLNILDNRFTNDIGASTVFVRNLTKTAARLRGNRLTGPVVPLEGPGSVEP